MTLQLILIEISFTLTEVELTLTTVFIGATVYVHSTLKFIYTLVNMSMDSKQSLPALNGYEFSLEITICILICLKNQLRFYIYI